MQYSYIEYFDGWEKIFPSGNLIEFQKKRYLELDSMVIDNDKEAKYIRGKKGFWCKKTLKLGHTDITTIDKVCDKFGKGKFVQMEALSARYSFINGKMVPTVQT